MGPKDIYDPKHKPYCIIIIIIITSDTGKSKL